MAPLIPTYKEYLETLERVHDFGREVHEQLGETVTQLNDYANEHVDELNREIFDTTPLDDCIKLIQSLRGLIEIHNDSLAQRREPEDDLQEMLQSFANEVLSNQARVSRFTVTHHVREKAFNFGQDLKTRLSELSAAFEKDLTEAKNKMDHFQIFVDTHGAGHSQYSGRVADALKVCFEHHDAVQNLAPAAEAGEGDALAETEEHEKLIRDAWDDEFVLIAVNGLGFEQYVAQMWKETLEAGMILYDVGGEVFPLRQRVLEEFWGS